MDFNEDVLDKIENYIDNYLKEMEAKYKGNQAAMDKIEHIKHVVALTRIVSKEDRMSIIAAKFHDIGRFEQLELLGGFNDGKVLHHILGEDVISRALFKGQLDVSDELNAIRQVVQFHGRQRFMPYKVELPEEVNLLIDVISRVDDIENGCIGATGYLEREARDDSKGYKSENPKLDMARVSDDVWNFFVKGEKFDKLKYCKTYADYTLFASVLAIQALKGKDRDLAKIAMDMKANGFSSALEGYKTIFSRLIDPKYADKAFEVLNGFYQDRNYSYNPHTPSDNNDAR